MSRVGRNTQKDTNHNFIYENVFLACHTNCDTGHPFIWSFPMTHDTCTYYNIYANIQKNNIKHSPIKSMRHLPKYKDKLGC